MAEKQDIEEGVWLHHDQNLHRPRFLYPRGRRLRGTHFFAGLFVTGLLALTSYIYLCTPPFLSTEDLKGYATSQQVSSYWNGWENIENMVVFGDSISSTHFQVHGPQPSKANPIGNPKFPGHTTANGPNWVSYMTAEYNTTFLKTINLAFSGATVDQDIIPPMSTGIKSMKDQIEMQWLPGYVPPPADFDWKAHDTLFVSFMGNNDARDAYLNSMGDWLSYSIDQYMHLLGVMYESGARNFLIMNVLPFERAPMALQRGHETIRDLGNIVNSYNKNLTQAVSEFSNRWSEATVFMLDSNRIFHDILDDPSSYQETRPLRVFDDYCEAYRTIKDDPYSQDKSCRYPADKYFWLSGVHPSFRVHEVIAKAAVEIMKGNSDRAVDY